MRGRHSIMILGWNVNVLQIDFVRGFNKDPNEVTNLTYSFSTSSRNTKQRKHVYSMNFLNAMERSHETWEFMN